MDVPAPLVRHGERAERQGRRQGVGRRRRPDAVDRRGQRRSVAADAKAATAAACTAARCRDAAAQAQPPRRHRRAAASRRASAPHRRGRVRARLRRPRRAQARARARRRSRQACKGSGEQGPHPEGGRRGVRQGRRRRAGASRAAAAGARRASICCRGRRSTSRSSARSKSKPLSRIKKISGANLHRNWVMIPHVTNHDDADITELEAFRVQLNKENEKSGVKRLDARVHDQGGVRDAREVSRVQRLARRRQPGAEEVLPHRLRRRHAERAWSCR